MGHAKKKGGGGGGEGAQKQIKGKEGKEVD